MIHLNLLNKNQNIQHDAMCTILHVSQLYKSICSQDCAQLMCHTEDDQIGDKWRPLCCPQTFYSDYHWLAVAASLSSQQEIHRFSIGKFRANPTKLTLSNGPLVDIPQPAISPSAHCQWPEHKVCRMWQHSNISFQNVSHLILVLTILYKVDCNFWRYETFQNKVNSCLVVFQHKP